MLNHILTRRSDTCKICKYKTPLNTSLFMVRMTTPPHPEMGSYPPDSSLFRGPGSEKREHTNCTEQTHKVSNPQVSGLRTCFLEANSLQRAFSQDLLHLYPTPSPDVWKFHILEGAGFLTNNFNLQSDLWEGRKKSAPSSRVRSSTHLPCLSADSN